MLFYLEEVILVLKVWRITLDNFLIIGLMSFSEKAVKVETKEVEPTVKGERVWNTAPVRKILK